MKYKIYEAAGDPEKLETILGVKILISSKTLLHESA
jgi:hypothetical protein